ncbi:GH92 family glycosyl hydrolase [Maribellus maritimus]|uniref:GH92 family glycosyl hydrolase n=1 Tax=Maribellus maritimus TaxID=2870838 RepID=UPI001EEA6654|nr:GH92 family glycosyl hydrolase [Maribellus maritimus]MCG6186830.1 GH92 family glycosyl hydrolase [Maribellus maritimus]
MKTSVNLLVVFFVIGSFFSACIQKQETKIEPASLVNVFVDTHNSRWFYFSSATRPFGMVNLSPDTDTKGSWRSGYLYDSKQIRCFSHIHAWQLSGVAVMPTVGEFKGNLGMDAYQSSFNHEGEIAEPGYHKVILSDYEITAELTSTARVGFHRYTYPKSNNSYIIFDTGAFLAHGPTKYSKVWKVNDTEVAGYEIMEATIRRPKATPVYFVAKLNKPIESFIGWEDSVMIDNPIDTIDGVNAGAAIKFQTTEREQVLMKVAVSYVSVEQARLNLETELAGWNFDQARKNSYDEWNKWLGKIEVEGGTHKQRVRFYTDLWHALQGRRIISDVNGKYLDMTGDTPRVKQVALDKNGKPLFPHYNFDAWWGSHWSLDILWSMAYPEVMDGFCNTMVDMYKDGGLIPRGPAGGNYTFVMIGDPSACFFATAYNKGIRNYDAETAYEGLRKNAFPEGSRDHGGYEHKIDYPDKTMVDYYLERGYVPEDVNAKGWHCGGVALTLEYAYQDWCLAQMAKNMKNEADYNMFMKRSENYKNVWNPQTGYMHPREQDGSWIGNFDPSVSKTPRGFCESNSAIYSYFVPHDIEGLAALSGGKDAFVEKLNSQFEKAQQYGFVPNKEMWVDYSNQPGTGMAHVFNKAGAPWLSQKWVRKVKEAFSDTTAYGGYNGDEDQGQMGALGVLMAIGLFEEDGGASANPSYELTSPLFDKITIHLDNKYYPGKTFIIETKNNSEQNMYIQSARLNGENWNKYWFSHKTFAKGGKLEIILGDKPNKMWGKP